MDQWVITLLKLIKDGTYIIIIEDSRTEAVPNLADIPYSGRNLHSLQQFVRLGP